MANGFETHNFFRISSLAYPNLLGKKGYVVVVVVGNIHMLLAQI